MERRLAAIVAADVVGYSRLIRADEEGTLLALRALREKLIDPKIKEHRGRTVKLMGDGMLVEFASVVDAVACSVDVQQALAVRNSSGPGIVFRVGINLEILPQLWLDVNGNYQFTAFESIKTIDKDIDTDTVTLGAMLRF